MIPSVSDVSAVVVRTGAASRAALGRGDSAAVFTFVSGLYLVGILYLSGELSFRSGIGVSMVVVDDPLVHMFRRRPDPFMHEPIALVDLWVVRYLFSPLNTLLALTVSVLVGLNLALSYLAITRPDSCGLRANVGVLASVPAILASSACCAPLVLLAVGIQASTLLLAAFRWLLPLGVALLVTALVYLAAKIDVSGIREIAPEHTGSG